MQQISSPSTFVVKRLIPTIYFGVVVLLFIYLFNRVSQHWASVAMLVVPALFGVIGYQAMRDNFRLVDEVWLDENDIEIHNSGLQERIPLSDLSSAEVASGGRGRHITLYLKKPSMLGDEIRFMQSADRNPPVEELLDEAYRKSQMNRKS